MNNIPAIVGRFTNNTINDITNNSQLFQWAYAHTVGFTCA